MDKNELATEIYKKAHLIGDFLLRSGQKSNEYFDKYLFESDPKILMAIIQEMKLLVPKDTEIIAGLELGGIPLVTALSIETGLNSVFVRKKAKEYGTCKIAEGCEIFDKNICIIEDVVTTGGQIIESVKELRNRGAKIKNVLCVIQRNSDASEILANKNLKLKIVFTMEYIKDIVKKLEKK
ncbi:MAG: orotate phosphoribosyltransferase [Treponema sp.]|nr:orotate phosphoribosyltransferase [Treponema sp.]